MWTSLTRRQTASAAIAFAAAIVMAISGLAPGFQRASAQDGATVEIIDFTFVPPSLTIEAGTTVTWVNQDAVAHTATGNNGEFDTGNIAPGASGSITFNTPGTYGYFCTIHPNMTGTVVVLAAGADDDAGDDDDAADDAANDDAVQVPATGIGFSGGGTGGNLIVSMLVLGCLAFGLGAVALRRRVA